MKYLIKNFTLYHYIMHNTYIVKKYFNFKIPPKIISFLFYEYSYIVIIILYFTDVKIENKIK